MADDSAVALQTEKGLFVITGCGHAGVVNTLEHARNVTGEQRIFGIMGGFHLKKRDRQTIETIHYLKKQGGTCHPISLYRIACTCGICGEFSDSIGKNR